MKASGHTLSRSFITAGFAVLACGAVLANQSRAGRGAPPPGAKVASGRHFDIYVTKTDEKPLAAGVTMIVYQVEAVARTQKHGTQRFRRRVETIGSNLLEAASWEIVDFDRDGWDDYRYVVSAKKSGCRTWEAEHWEPDHDRFVLAPKFSRSTDAQNKPVPGGCALK